MEKKSISIIWIKIFGIMFHVMLNSKSEFVNVLKYDYYIINGIILHLRNIHCTIFKKCVNIWAINKTSNCFYWFTRNFTTNDTIIYNYLSTKVLLIDLEEHAMVSKPTGPIRPWKTMCKQNNQEYFNYIIENCNCLNLDLKIKRSFHLRQ